MHSYFFFNDTATTEIYTLSLHDALPISGERRRPEPGRRPPPRLLDRHPEGRRDALAAPKMLGQVLPWCGEQAQGGPTAHHQLLAGDHPPVGAEQERGQRRDRKSTRLNSSHANISYAVFCL